MIMSKIELPSPKDITAAVHVWHVFSECPHSPLGAFRCP